MTEVYLLKTISEKSEHFEATRTRTSSGYSSIRIQLLQDKDDGKEDKANPRLVPNEITFDTDRIGSNYELWADEFATLLGTIASKPCLLPKGTQ